MTNPTNPDFYTSADYVEEIGEQDEREDLIDHPPVNAAMVLPNGARLNVMLRLIEKKKIRKKKKKKKKKHRELAYRRSGKGSKGILEKLEELIDKTDHLFFLIYNLFMGPKKGTAKFDRIAKWVNLRIVGAKIEARQLEADCKREDALEETKDSWRDILDEELAPAILKDPSLSKEVEGFASKMSKDLEDFFKGEEWLNLVEAFCKDPLGHPWFRDDNHDLLDRVKAFLLKKHGLSILQRYKTLLADGAQSLDTPAVAALRQGMEKALKRYLKGLLQIEEAYHQDLLIIEEKASSEHGRTGWIHAARKALEMDECLPSWESEWESKGPDSKM